jgi:chemotaxis regulatin CheY-phosphate phosphatase CheZ
MTSSRAKEVLYDSETMLRLVDNELEELRDPVAPQVEPQAEPQSADRERIDAWLSVVQQASTEISQVMAMLQDSRQALHGVTLDHLHVSTAKIQDVSAAAETAATNIMDRVDRAQGLIDRLEQLSAADGDAGAASVRASLRDELFGMMGALQFQDITAQQLEHVSSMLIDVEHRLLSVSALLGGMPGASEALARLRSVFPSNNSTYSASASTRDADIRQAAADELVRMRHTP